MSVSSFKIKDKRSFRITTSSGTVYKLSPPDKAGVRDIIRIAPQGESAGTFIMRPIDLHQEKAADDDSNFKGMLLSDVQVGQPMIIGKGETGAQRIISDTVNQIIDMS